MKKISGGKKRCIEHGKTGLFPQTTHQDFLLIRQGSLFK